MDSDKIWVDIATKNTSKTCLAALPNRPKYLGYLKKNLIGYPSFVVWGVVTMRRSFSLRRSQVGSYWQLGVNILLDCVKTFTENWDSKRHLLELSWPTLSIGT